MMTDAQKKASRKQTNAEYYRKNHTKWGSFYPKSTVSILGTGNLAAHKLDDEDAELLAVRREMRRLGVKRAHAKVYKSVRRG